MSGPRVGVKARVGLRRGLRQALAGGAQRAITGAAAGVLVDGMDRLAEERGGPPRPARIGEHRPGERDDIGLAFGDDLLGDRSGSSIRPTARVTMPASRRIRSAKGTM